MARIFKTSDNTFRYEGDVFITSDLTISGDLTINGSLTTIDTLNLEIEDNVIILNKNEAGAGVSSGTSGIEIERGSQPNVSWIFDESDDTFKPQGTSGLGNISTISASSGAISFDSNVNFSNEIESNFIPSANNTYNLGSVSNSWLNIYSSNIISSTVQVTGFTGTSSDGIIYVPVGNTSQRPSSPTSRGIRYNTDEDTFEGYDGTQWRPLQGGGQFTGENGLVGDNPGDIFRLMEDQLDTNTTIPVNRNAHTAGPLTIAPGVVITVDGNLTIS